MDKVTILIPTRYDSLHIIDLCLRTIRKYTEVPYNIVVGDVGVNDETRDFLLAQNDIRVVTLPDPFKPKNDLVKEVETPYFIFLHDDIKILKRGWLKRRLEIMKQDPLIGLLGIKSFNYEPKGAIAKRLSTDLMHKFKYFTNDLRFFPLAMMGKKQTQDDLELYWGKIKGFDTGAIAYHQFKLQKKWKFVDYGLNGDIKHFSGMTWIKRVLSEKRYKLDSDERKKLYRVLDVRERNIEIIKKMLDEDDY